ncbi:ABC1 kinase family protein [Natronobacterium gregoryi]|uniref:ABC-1 domain-containing protein n=2 Tax=Natronobacterium gregoryi TaxID=44930 RepID=L0ALL0_NATGS|nr:AarF/ABC1/UbiB kinase family protein [Natronobacterium gregoryi]AFZ74339.1 putative unusual protein kinase [Natronobacterium gregoryi SP2]ELY63435.1 ABC-1 domain-containing protein [Natronobacterium gregoryi SP2]PLK22151.1 AarF/ABC1/UbiB kinase family protein [Natronobacterium gregoryi SP2]SFI54028.1 Predicted unusual protein kinase regulating ubiquinone biosynthesis, AarF/ABC1/UbiB family [Natronobacterium gregoryi]
MIAYARDRRRFLLFGGRRQVDPETHRYRANVLLESLLDLGPTFIKLGQLLSTRPDVLPPAYIDVLSSLQDDVPPAEWDGAKEVLEDELGPVDDRFVSFDTDPISGASLGQVYRARIDDDGTREVAVKIRRPGVEELVRADLRVIHWSLPILLYFVDDARAFSLENLADEFSKTIREEMDYEREAEMLQEIKSNLAVDDRCVVPDVIESHSSPRVLTMEYIGGTKINDVEELDRRGIDRGEIAENLQRVYMQMIIDDGVFHADPHPGNLAVTDDGRIVFYDFGMSGRVDEYLQEKIVDFYAAVANQDIESILDVLIEIGTLSPDADRAVMTDVIELAIQDARGEDIEQYRVHQVIGRVEDSIYEFPLRLPKNLALVLRVATVVEGVCVTLDQDYDFIATATDYLIEQGYREESIRRYIRESGEQILQSADSLTRIAPKTERALDRLERDDLSVRVGVEDSQNVFENLAKRLIYGMLLTMSLFSMGVLYALEAPEASLVAAAFSVVVGIQLYRSFRRVRAIRARPQFTRQSLRQRRGDE